MIIPSQITSDGYLLRATYGYHPLVIAVAGYLWVIPFPGIAYPMSVSINSGRTFAVIGDGQAKVDAGSGRTFSAIGGGTTKVNIGSGKTFTEI